MESKRKNFSGAQKAKVAFEAISGEKMVNQIAQEYGVRPLTKFSPVWAYPLPHVDSSS